MSKVSGRATWLAVACLAALVGLFCLAGPPPAQAEDTVWICKPGQADDLCAGSISTKAGGQVIGFDRPDNPPVDCFYLYPTQSEQKTPNANLDKDPPIRRVVVQQARMFSRVCDVYAPMYRQETAPGVYSESTEVAYQSALAGWKDYLENYNHGRGVILLGHSQGSATLGRLIDEEIDPNPTVRKRLVGAILPGGNIYVPKGKLVGGMYDHVPVCSKAGEYGCLVAYSTFNGTPPDNPPFADVGSGYWAYKIPRPSRDEYEVVCANPAELSGKSLLTPLINMDYLLEPPADGVETKFWNAYPDAASASCDREGTKHWLNVQFAGTPDPFLVAMIPVVASGNNWHVPEVNIAEENLVEIAQLQTDSYIGEQNRIAKAKAKLKKLRGNLTRAKKRLKKASVSARKLDRKARKAKGNRKQALKRKAKRARRKASSERRRIKSLKRQISQTKKKIS